MSVDVPLRLSAIVLWFFALQTFIHKVLSAHHNINTGCHFDGGETLDCHSRFPSMKSGKSSNNKAMGQKLEKDLFPDTLQGFGYEFNSEGQLRHIDTKEPFNFEVKPGDRAFNQKHYEALGEVITDYVYGLLETKGNLIRLFLPVDAGNEPLNFIFHSENAFECDKLMILIHGSGVVRAGQWTRKLIINDCLDSGTMLPYIRKAAEEGYGILVTNGNNNFVTVKTKRKPIRGSKNPEEHFLYVWDHVIRKAKASTINIVAHSYGGVVTVHVSKERKNEFLKRVKGVAFTDSVHSLAYQVVDKEIQHFFQKNSRNWVSCDKPLDSPVAALFKIADCERVSAGTIKHEETSWAAFESVFKYFAEKQKEQNSASSVNTGPPGASDGEQQKLTTQPQHENITEKTTHSEISDQGLEQKKDITEEAGHPGSSGQVVDQKEDITEEAGHPGSTDQVMDQKKDITKKTGHPGSTDQVMDQKEDITEEAGHSGSTDQVMDQNEDITKETGHPGSTDQVMDQKEGITEEAGHPGSTDQLMDQKEDITEEAGHAGSTDHVMDQKKNITEETGHAGISDQGMDQKEDITEETGHLGTTNQGIDKKKNITDEAGHPVTIHQVMDQKEDINEERAHPGSTGVGEFDHAPDTSEDKTTEDKTSKEEL